MTKEMIAQYHELPRIEDCFRVVKAEIENYKQIQINFTGYVNISIVDCFVKYSLYNS